MMLSDYIVLGSSSKPSAWKGKVGANIPGTKWTNGLVRGMRSSGSDVRVLGHYYDQSWPKGSLFPGKKECFDWGIQTHSVPFSNLPFVRNFELKWQYKRSLRCLDVKDSSILITYNPLPYHVVCGNEWIARGRKWINIVLDYDERDIGDDWTKFKNTCGNASGQIFLSWWAFQNYPGEKKMHLDAGCDEIYFDLQSRRSNKKLKRVFHGGFISYSKGSQTIAAAIEKCTDPNLEFIFAGRGQCDVLSGLALKDSRIKLLGYVEDDKMHELSMGSDVFLNARNPDVSINRMIFPSKITQYLSYGKPIVSTFTGGLAPVYEDLLLMTDGSPLDFSRKIESAARMSNFEWVKLREKIHSFIQEDRNWPNQAKRLKEFCEII